MVMFQLILGWVNTMKIISALASIPVMVIAALLLKPSLISSGVFITALVLELMLASVMKYGDEY